MDLIPAVVAVVAVVWSLQEPCQLHQALYTQSLLVQEVLQVFLFAALYLKHQAELAETQYLTLQLPWEVWVALAVDIILEFLAQEE